MNQKFLLFGGKCRVDRFKSNFFLVTPRGRTLHQILPPASSLTRNPVYYTVFMLCHGRFFMVESVDLEAVGNSIFDWMRARNDFYSNILMICLWRNKTVKSFSKSANTLPGQIFRFLALSSQISLLDHYGKFFSLQNQNKFIAKGQFKPFDREHASTGWKKSTLPLQYIIKIRHFVETPLINSNFDKPSSNLT